MTIDDAIKLTDAMTKLAGALAWPLLIAFLLIRFAPALRDFFESLAEFGIKTSVFEFTAKKKAEVAAALAAATTSRAEPGTTSATIARNTQEAVDLVAAKVTPKLLRKARQSTILWVDDQPANNVYEQRLLEALGVTFILAKSTEEAIVQLGKQQVDAIISDMGRPPDPQAGYTLLSQLRAAGNTIPFIIYAGSNAPEHKAEACRKGALGSTNQVSELFEYVLSVLRLVI